LLLEVVQGKRSALELNGHLLLVAWEEERQQWHIWTDRFGSLHAYYARSGTSTALSTCFETAARLASRRELDWEALTGFFGFGFFPQDRTFFKDVRILWPATHYVFNETGEQISAERYWHWHHRPDGKRSYDDTVAEFGSLFTSAMRDRVREGRVALPISGGLDSRCTVAAIDTELLSTLNSQPSTHLWAYSYGYSDDSIEMRIARQLAAARGLPFNAFTVKPYLFSDLARVLGAVEGFQDLTQCRQATVFEELREKTDYVIAAHWGDVWLDDMGLTRATPSDSRSVVRGPWSNGLVTEHTLEKMVKKGREWLLKNLAAPKLGKESPQELLTSFVREALKPLEHIEDPDFRVKAYKTENWSFRWTLASLRMFQAAAFPRLPFYDTRLTDFFCTVPSEYVQGRRLQIDYLKRFAPDLARIEWQPYRANLYDYQKADPLALPKRAANKLWRTLAGKQVIERNWEVQFSGEQGEAGLRNWLTRPGLRLHEFVPKAEVQSLLNSFRSEPLKNGHGYTVSMLLTFSAWLEHHA
jgi:hypothetical protein